MDVWHLALFAAAIALAMRSLVGLMDNYRIRMRHDLLQKELRLRQANRMREAADEVSKEHARGNKPKDLAAAGATIDSKKQPAGKTQPPKRAA